jgi:FSR family fosmidomycin resistance protein-like MFS transporter
MAQAIDMRVRAGRGRGRDARVIWLVGAAHFVSHYYILLLPPLFPFVRAEYGVSYTELGLALAAFNTVSAGLQTPAGFLTDRIGAPAVLIGGLLLGAFAFALAGIVPSFWFLVAMFAVAGLGNTVYHPADYSILSHHVLPERIGQAYSIHTFAGMLGTALAPASLLVLQSTVGWRGAFLAAALLGIAAAVVMLLQRDALSVPVLPTKQEAKETGGSFSLLFSLPLLRNLAFFVMLAITAGGLQNYSVVALGALYGTPLSIANSALSLYLLLITVGVLLGGLLAGRTQRHELVAIGGLVVVAVTAITVGVVPLGSASLIGVMAVGGLFSGLIMPSRDMIVRAMTPPGSFGKVFGFVTTGFNLGGIISPLLFGWLMDQGHPRAIFLLGAAFSLLSIPTVLSFPARRAAGESRA